MRLIIEISRQNDANLLISLLKRLKGKIIGESNNIIKAQSSKKINPVALLETISKRGGIASINDPSAWQRETRGDRKLEGRDEI